MSNNIILLVEDNPDDVELTLRAFKKSNLKNEIAIARDGVEALDFLFGTGSHAGRETAEVPQLIMLDLNIPKIDGLEVLQAMRADERTKLIPVVVLTSSREQEDIVKSYRFGANSFVRKPVDFLEFVQAVQQLELYWVVLNERPRQQ
ncbi:MAG: response regulator [Anaerolineae bacterium]|nr:response regulator [Anaerolineae bacterium]